MSGRAIFYADRITGSMQRCMDETTRRRTLQRDHNEANGIEPRGVEKSIEQVRFITRVADARESTREREAARVSERKAAYEASDLPTLIAQIEEEMKEAAKALDFETAARLRDELFELKAKADGGSRRRPATADLRAGRGS